LIFSKKFVEFHEMKKKFKKLSIAVKATRFLNV